MKNHSRSALAALSIAFVLMLAACSSSTPTLRYITISPQTANIAVSTTQQFTALAYFSDGTVKDGTGLVSWSSSDAAIATINASGVATGVAPGTVTITGNAAGTSGATVTLNVSELKGIVIAPATATIPNGETQQYTATGTFTNPDGSTGTSPVTSLATWTSSNTMVATIDNTGLATAAAASGTSNITASLYGITSNTAVLTAAPPVVTGLAITPATPSAPVGGAVNLKAAETLSDGTTQAPTGTVTWSSDATTTATVLVNTSNSSLAVATAIAAASNAANITATEGELKGKAALTVVTGVTNFAYVANVNPGSLGYFQVDVTATPALSNYTTAPALASSPFHLAVHPAGGLLYVVDYPGSFLHTLTIDPKTGAPAETTASKTSPPLAGSGGQNHIAIDPYGRFLYVTDDTGNTIYGFTIDQTQTTNPGALTLIGTTTAHLNGPEDIVIDPTGTYAYVTNSGSAGTDANTVSAYSINQTTGALTALATPTAATGTTPYFETLDPTGKYLYVANSGGDTVSVFTLGTGGALGTATTFTVTGATSILNVAVAPSGKYIYFLDYGDGTTPGAVYAYALNADGTIGAALGSAVATGVAPIAITTDATGAGVAVTNNTDAGTLSLYSINSDGSLKVPSTPTVAVGGAPWWTAVYNAAAAPSGSMKKGKAN